MTVSVTMTLTIEHKGLDHTNFSSLKTFFQHLNIAYIHNFNDFICDSCHQAKTKKIYNCQPQDWAQQQYQFVYINFIGPINPVSFGRECYFFIFTDDYTRITEIYTGTKKNNWLRCLKTYYSLCRIWSKHQYLIERLRSDYGSELQSYKTDK